MASRVWPGAEAPCNRFTPRAPARVDGVGRTQVRGRVVTPHGVLDDGLVLVQDGRVAYVGPPPGPADADPSDTDPSDTDPSGRVDLLVAPAGGYVLPGLVDVHNHGGGGASFGSGGLRGNGIAADEHLRHGTTSLLAGLATDSPDRMLAAAVAAADAADQSTVAGILAEGPFLSPHRCGAQHPEHLAAPDAGFTAELLAAGRGHVKVMTVAPELDGAAAVLDLLLAHGVVPAVGHTEADAGLVRRTLSQTRAALGRPGLVTHLFNGMPLLHHRDPGPAAGALAAAARGDAYVELVADGVHLADETVRMVFDLVGPEGIVLVTDAMAGAGMPDGDYELGGQRVRVADGVARLGAEGPLAGGTAHLLDVVRRCVAAGIPLQAAVAAATTSPAAATGLDRRGTIAPGHRADLVVTGSDLVPVAVVRDGRRVG